MKRIVIEVMKDCKFYFNPLVAVTYERIASKLLRPKCPKLRPSLGVGIMSFGLVASLLCYRDYILRYLFRILGISYDSGMMTRKETDRYLQAILSTYHASSKTKKGELLTYSEFITKRPRKSLIRRLRELSAPPPNGDVGIKRVGRPASYSKSELMPHIGYLWNQMERLSAKRMKAALPDWLPRYKACPAHLRTQIEKMSASTLDRYLRELRASLVTSKGFEYNKPG